MDAQEQIQVQQQLILELQKQNALLMESLAASNNKRKVVANELASKTAPSKKAKADEDDDEQGDGDFEDGESNAAQTKKSSSSATKASSSAGAAGDTVELGNLRRISVQKYKGKTLGMLESWSH